ncbi:hypothetical protein MKEN_01322100 [Mycena kentingensis (nom. inval.)]|nr:hypothetical protein MKEN_01322100 [Mycena kentingensis (nom. inval.)]
MVGLFPPGVTLDNTFGAAFIGFAMSCAALGVCTNQAITYFARYPEDKVAYKLLVVLVWLLTCVDQALIGHAVYFYTISNYANPLILLKRVEWTLIVQLTVGAAIGTIVRLCFAMRVWRFSQRNIIVTVLVVLLTVAEMGLAIAFTVKCFENPFLTVLPDLKVIASLALGGGALADVVIAVSLCFFLRRYRTGSKRANTLVTTLTVYAVNTGAVTAAISVGTLLFYDLRPSTFQFLAFYFILCKLYTISFFCTLNTRRVVRGKGTERSDGRSDGHSGPTGLSGHTAGRSGHTFQPRATGTGTLTGNGTGTRGTVGMGTASFAPGFGLSNMAPAHSTGGTYSTGYGQNVEIGVHHEVSIISDVDDGKVDWREHKDDMELSPTRTSPGPYSFAYTGPYAYSPSTSPTYTTNKEDYVHAYAR